MTAQSPVCVNFNQIGIFFKINQLHIICVQKNGIPARNSLNQVLSPACAKRFTREGLILLSFIKVCENWIKCSTSSGRLDVPIARLAHFEVRGARSIKRLSCLINFKQGVIGLGATGRG